MDHPQVKADQRAVSRRRQFPVKGSEVLHRLRLPGQRLRLIQHLRPAEQPGEAQQGRAGGVLPEGGEHIPQGGEVFALDQGPHPLHLPLLQLHPGGHIPEEAGVAQLHMEP